MERVGQVENNERTKKKQMSDDIIFIGAKPFMNYVTAVVMMVTIKKLKEIKIIARGKVISKAVDVVEVTRNNFLKGEHEVDIKDIKIASEKFERKEDNKPINVSTIEIILLKKE